MSTWETRVRENLSGNLLQRALAPRQEGGPLGITIAAEAQAMTSDQIGQWIIDDNRYIREGAEGVFLEECMIRLGLLTAELDRRD